ncbi:unnamed protein product [Sphagnum jensenii]|uniref:Terminase large subunit gp17-like C-terminal domain-containing protein n=1 Tax=Sphagnum jensenii TaxID=128206 RepID=A0ABP0V941_9BRYO
MHATLNYPDHWNGYRYKKKNLTLWLGGITGFEADDLSRRLFEGSGNDPAFIHESLVVYSNRKDRRHQIKNALGGITNIAIKTYGGREQQNELSTWKASKVDCILLDEQPTMSVFVECCMRIMNTEKDDHGMIIIAATCTRFTPFVLSFTERVEKTEIDREGQKVGDEKQVKIASGEVRDGKVFLLAGWNDAQHLEEEQKKNMRANMLPMEVDARTKGLPSIGSGMVYPVLEELITCDPFEIPNHYASIIGMDFGWSDPTALTFGALDRNTGILYITFEYSMSAKTPDSHLADLQTMRGADSLKWAYVMADPAGQASSQKDGESLFMLYRQKGLNLVKADNARSAGILTCLQMILDGRLKIFKTCPKILNEIRGYAYDEQGRLIDGNDHLLDAMRYMVGGVGHAKTETKDQDDWSFLMDRHRGLGIM